MKSQSIICVSHDYLNEYKDHYLSQAGDQVTFSCLSRHYFPVVEYSIPSDA